MNTINSIKNFLVKREWLLVAIIAVVFICLRLPGTDLPLHQDEYKWPIAVNPAQSKVIIPHPPLGELIYKTAGGLIGFNVNFRFVPLFFGTLNLLLLYYFVRKFFGRKEAVVASLLWTFSYFSVLASLMVDTDGQVMPFFFLILLIGYFNLRYGGYAKKEKTWWAVVLILGCFLGFLVKVSFLLAVGAIVADFLWSKRKYVSIKLLVRYLLYALAAVAFLILALLAMKQLFPFFRLEASVTYWKHFAVGDRNWFQTGIQCIKAILYSSPLLVLTPFLLFKKDSSIKENFYKIRPFLFFLSFAFLFYVVLFDFSIGALDRYLQLLILPLVVLTTFALSKVFAERSTRVKEFVLLGLAVGFTLVLLQSLPHFVPPLHPKALWISRALSLKWNFVYPFSGGSGPLGFYISFLFIALSWIISAGVLLYALWKPKIRVLALAFLLPIGLLYNGIFIEEYLVGFWNGHAPKLLLRGVAFVKNNPDITAVTVYNDNGGNEIQATGKYHRRLYVDPMFDLAGKIEALNTDKEHYFMLDVPRLDPTSVYQKYFDTCAVVFKETDKKMSVTVFDCQNVPDVSL